MFTCTWVSGAAVLVLFQCAAMAQPAARAGSERVDPAEQPARAATANGPSGEPPLPESSARPAASSVSPATGTGTAQPPPAPPSPASGSRRQAADDALDDPADDLRSFVTDEPPRSRLNVAAWAGSGVTVALLGIAAFYGASAAGKEGDLNRLLGYRDNQTGMPVEYATVATTFEEDMRAGRRDNQIAKGMAIAAGATAVASAVMFIVDGLRGKAGDPPARFAISLSPERRGPAGVGIVWSLRR